MELHQRDAVYQFQITDKGCQRYCLMNINVFSFLTELLHPSLEHFTHISGFYSRPSIVVSISNDWIIVFFSKHINWTSRIHISGNSWANMFWVIKISVRRTVNDFDISFPRTVNLELNLILNIILFFYSLW